MSSLVIVAALLYCSWPLGFWLNPVATRTGLASELGGYHQPYNWFFIGADVLSGVLLLWAVLVLYRMLHPHKALRVCLVLLGIYGVCGALDAVMPLKCLPSLQVCGPIFNDPMLVLHGVVDITGSLTLIGTLVAAWVYVRQHNRKWLVWLYIIGGGGVVFGVLSAYFLLTHGPGYWAQRYYITLSCVWVATIPFALLGPNRATLKKLNN